MSDDDDFMEGCDLDFTQEVTADEESGLFVLFAEALDPGDPKSVEEAEAEWKAVFGESA